VVKENENARKRSIHKYIKTVEQRMNNFISIVGRPGNPINLVEGFHYECIDFALRNNEYLPILLKWRDGTYDDLTNHFKTQGNLKRAIGKERVK